MTYDEQLKLWVEGTSLHKKGEDECCCPDFSCCKPELLAPKEERERYYEAYVSADDDTVGAMLMMFLTAGMNKLNEGKETPVDVHVAGFQYE